MKRGRKLTRRQKELLKSYGYDYNDFLVERKNEKSCTFIHRLSKKTITLDLNK